MRHTATARQAALFALSALLTLLAQAAATAQTFVYPDWSRWELDTLPPLYCEQRTLSADQARNRFVATVEYPEYEELSAKLADRWHLHELDLGEEPAAECRVGISAKQPILDISLLPVVRRNGHFLRLKSFRLSLAESAPLRTAASRSGGDNDAAQRYASHSVLSSGRWVKISVAQEGIHQITHAELAKMGFNDPQKVRLYGYGGQMLPQSGIEWLTDDLPEQPLWRQDNRLLFYARGTVAWQRASNGYTHTRNPYATRSYYFLTADDSIAPMPFPTQEAASGGTPVDTYPDYALYEVDKESWGSFGRQLFDGYNYASGSTQHYQFDLAGATGEGTLTVQFSTDGTSGSTLSVECNGQSAGLLTLGVAGKYAVAVTAQKNLTVAPTASTRVTLTHNAASGQSGRLDYLRFNYTRTLALRGSSTNFRAGQQHDSAQFAIQGADAHTLVWRVTDTATTACIEGSARDGCYCVTTPCSADDEFVALAPGGTFPGVSVEGTVQNQDLHALGQCDYVIIVPASGIYTAQAERLAEAHRTLDAMTVAVVRADEVYNEFSSGTPDATAYRRLMKMLYDRAADARQAPKYLLLFGAGVWDNRLLTPAFSKSNPDNLLLCFESENSVSETRSYVMEDYFGLLDDGEGTNLLTSMVDIGVGRLPVQSSKQADEVVQKIVRYMQNSEAGGWKNTICFLGDDGDNNQHMNDAESVAQMVEKDYPAYRVRRIYWDSYPMEVASTGNRYPDVQKEIARQSGEGALIFNFTGHGAPGSLSHEIVLSTADFTDSRTQRLPVWITAACDVGPFDSGNSSIGVESVLNPQGGAIAMLTTTRTVYSAPNRNINEAFTHYLLGRDADGRRHHMGDALRLAKCEMISGSASMRDLSENKLQFVLLGDPALKLAAPEHEVAVDSFNGQPADAHDICVAAGGTVTFTGYVKRDDGSVADDYDGLVYPVVMDNAEDIVCRNNQRAADNAFTYTDRAKTLYSGCDSVRGGRFSVTFPVPLDINYSFEPGRLTLYTTDNAHEREAHGSYGNFALGGTSDQLPADSVGPQIELWLNDTRFADGDQVNTTPLLLATLSDPQGINTVGNGIGHDIVASIDNAAAYTYTLNSYYDPVPGDYTRGSIGYSLPTLPEGEHTLTLRAWDLLNNSAERTIHFTVVKGLAPHISLSATPNPAGDRVTFTVEHDRPQSEVTVKLELFNFMGQMLWSHSESSSGSATYSCEWDMRTSGGQPLLPGVYLYRAHVSSDGSSRASQTRKIIVVRQ